MRLRCRPFCPGDAMVSIRGGKQDESTHPNETKDLAHNPEDRLSMGTLNLIPTQDIDFVVEA